MPEILEVGEYPAEMEDRKGKKALAIKVMDITDHFPNPTCSVTVHYGLMPRAEEVVVQLVKEPELNKPVGSSIMPLSVFDEGKQLSEEVTNFLQSAKCDPEVVALLVRDHAP